MKKLWAFLSEREPQATAMVVSAAVNLGVAFGLRWDEEQLAVVNVFVATLLGWLLRKSTASTAEVVEKVLGAVRAERQAVLAAVRATSLGTTQGPDATVTPREGDLAAEPGSGPASDPTPPPPSP